MAIITGDDTAAKARGFRFSSDLRDDIWHADAEAGAYEWWYFDAISDDGREALVIIFLADFIFSPRYNRAAAAAERLQTTGGGESPPSPQFPAVSFCLYRDGRPALRVVNEYAAADFQASQTRPECRIGASHFQLEESGTERRFRLTLDEPLRGGQRLRGTFTWEMIEGDYVRVDETPGSGSGAHSHEWNLVAPRCRVSGSYNVGGQEQQAFGQKQFAGVGYHDHNRDQRWLPATVASWQWGRAHFPDATVVFYRYREIVEQIDSTRVFLIRRDQLSRHAAVFTSDRARRHHFGVRFSRAIEIAFEEQTKHLTLHVNQQKIVDASYFYLRFLGDATLTLGDNRTQHAPAITEHLAPRALRWRWLDWLTDMRIGRHGRASFLP